MNEKTPFVRFDGGRVDITDRTNRAYYRWSYQAMRRDRFARHLVRLVLVGDCVTNSGAGITVQSTTTLAPPVNT